MFVILLKFTNNNKQQAGQYMQGHNDWIAKGLVDGIFLLSGSLQPNQGGAIIAQGETRQELSKRLSEDPFVAENIVKPDLLEITPARASDHLHFLLPGA